MVVAAHAAAAVAPMPEGVTPAVKRFQRFRSLFRELNIIRNLGEEIEDWNYQKLDETNRVANIIKKKINS